MQLSGFGLVLVTEWRRLSH